MNNNCLCQNNFILIILLKNLLLKASVEGWIIKIVDFGLSNTHEVSIYFSKINSINVIIIRVTSYYQQHVAHHVMLHLK